MREIVLDTSVDFSMGAVNLMLDEGKKFNLGSPQQVTIRHWINGDPDDWFMMFENGMIVSKGQK